MAIHFGCFDFLLLLISMDASEGKPNGPQTPYQPVQFRHVDLQKDYVVYAAGTVHAAAAGVHGPIGVVLTGDGEVWTWGMIWVIRKVLEAAWKPGQ